MRKSRKQKSMNDMIAKALIWVAGKAIESMPVIGPVFKVLSFVNDVAELRRTKSPRRARSVAAVA